MSASLPLGVLLAVCLTPASVGAAISDWYGEGNARVRLLATGQGPDGSLAAGIEVVLDPGWKTYWRSPGDAGIAPRIDFSGSTNVAEPVEIAFPVPHRFDDGYAVSNVYEDRVVFVVDAPLVKPGSDTELVVTLDMGVCELICIPEHYEMSLDVRAGDSDPEAQTILDRARALLPSAPEPGKQSIERVWRSGGDDKRPIFGVEIVAPDPENAEVFVEGPFDWYAAPPDLVSAGDGRATYSVRFSRIGSKIPIGDNDFRVTVVSDGEAIEDVVTLD